MTSSPPSTKTTLAVSSAIARLRSYNLVAACAHLAQGILILVLANSFALPVTASYMTGPPGGTEPRDLVQLFDLRTAWVVAAFFFCSAIAHFAVAGPGGVGTPPIWPAPAIPIAGSNTRSARR